MAGERTARPRGWVRHYAGLLSLDAAAGMEIVLARDPLRRARRLAGGAADRARQRVMPTRPQMRALQALPGGRLRWQRVPVPAPPGPDGAIVRPIASATCDIDGAILAGRGVFALPLHLGHECVAEVLAVGERVRSVQAGDRAVVPFQISCGRCPACAAGHTGNCLGVPPVSMYGMGMVGGGWGGAFSEQMAVPFAEAMLVALPDGVDPVAAAAVADNVCDAYRHIGPHLPGLLREDSDSEVLVLGALGRRASFAPSTPLYCALIARALGARRVTFADARRHVRELAERLGLQAISPRELHGRPPAPLVADVSAGELGAALSATAPDGICSSSGSFHRGARVPTMRMYGRNVTLHFGRAHVRALIPAVLELIAARKLDPQAAISMVVSFEDAPRALAKHLLGGGIKAVVTA